MKKFNVIADAWTNGKYCLGTHVSTLAEAERWAVVYTARYEGKKYPNGKGWYSCHNFRAIEVEAP